MTSAEEGQPPFNEPEEWQDTHPLSTLIHLTHCVLHIKP